MKKRVAILGSTGSIGKCIINIIKKDKKNFEILFLAANSNYKELLKQAKIFNVKNILIADKKVFEDVSSKYQKVTKINFHNNNPLINILKKNRLCNYLKKVINGLEPTLKIIKFTKNIAIANKEAIICGWNLIKKDLKKL